MKISVVGSPEDVRGFSLAGLTGQAAGSPLDVEAALRSAAQEGSDVGLLLVSAEAARLASELVTKLERREGVPVLMVLPEGLKQ